MKNTASNQTAMRLHDAMVCVNCETVYNIMEHRQCPGCASRTAIPLARVCLSIVPKPLAPAPAEPETRYAMERI